MVYDPNPTWTARLGNVDQPHVYFLRIDGYGNDFATAPVQAPTQPKILALNIPRTTRAAVDILEGRLTVQSATVELADVDGELTRLIATEAPGAPLAALKNREATIYGGYRGDPEADYPPVFVGRVTAVRALGGLTGYQLTLTRADYLLEGELFVGATDDNPQIVRGNVVNVYQAILTGNTADPRFPLDYVSSGLETLAASTEQVSGFSNPDNALTNENTFAEGGPGASMVVRFASGLVAGRLQVRAAVPSGSMTLEYSENQGSTWNTLAEASQTDPEYLSGPILEPIEGGRVLVRATVSSDAGAVGRVYLVRLGHATPTFLDVAASQIDLDQLELQRDTWRPDDAVRVLAREPEDGRSWLETEIFRVFQCWPAIRGNGRIGLAFFNPAIPIAANPEVTEADLVEVAAWEPQYANHLNQFEISGDFDPDTNEFEVLWNAVTQADLDDQAATQERILYRAQSRLLSSRLDGSGIGQELVGRLRLWFLKMPAALELGLTMRKRNLEVGDTIQLSVRKVPNLATGTRGLDRALLLVTGISPRFDRGLIALSCIEVAGLKRYGVFGDATIPDYGAASADQRGLYHFYAAESTKTMGNGDPAYRFL